MMPGDPSCSRDGPCDHGLKPFRRGESCGQNPLNGRWVTRAFEYADDRDALPAHRQGTSRFIWDVSRLRCPGGRPGFSHVNRKTLAASWPAEGDPDFDRLDRSRGAAPGVPAFLKCERLLD